MCGGDGVVVGEVCCNAFVLVDDMIRVVASEDDGLATYDPAERKRTL